MTRKTFKITQEDLVDESIKQTAYYKHSVGKIPTKHLFAGLVLNNLSKSIKDYVSELTFSGSLVFIIKFDEVVYSTYVPEITDSDEEEIYRQSAQHLVNCLIEHVESFKVGDKVTFEVKKFLG